jgi:DNA polymerase-1
MPIYHDIHIQRFLSGTRIQGDFATYIQKSLDIVWDGTPTAKLHILADPTHTKENTHIDIQADPIYLLESALIPILADMETTGVCIDRAKLQDIGMRINVEKSLREAEIYDLVGERFNINSPKQLQEIFVKMNIPMTKKNKTGYSLDNDVLEEIAGTYPIARTVIAYRTLAKLKSTYTDGLLRAIDTKTSKIHTHYNQLGAATGRMSSEDPNLQNIPTGVGYPSEIKSCFGPSI